ncbi:hypothetical protein AAMO2058_001250500 [Amorphochlora amoebiformis]
MCPRDMTMYFTVIYLFLNLLAYRVLLSKAAIYDAMTQFVMRQRLICWIVHVISSLIVILVGLNTWVSLEYQTVIIDSEGEKACAGTVTGLSRTLPGSMVLIVDVGMSLACLYLLLLPIVSQKRIHFNQMGANRNVLWALVAIISTFAFLAFTVVQHGGTPPVYNFQRISIGLIDATINIFAINMCWPVSFYLRIFQTWGLISASRNDIRSLAALQTSGKPTNPRHSSDKKLISMANAMTHPMIVTQMRSLCQNRAVSPLPASVISGSNIRASIRGSRTLRESPLSPIVAVKTGNPSLELALQNS